MICFIHNSVYIRFPGAQLVKNPPAMWETWVQPLGREDPLEEGTATHSSDLAGESRGRGAWQAQRAAHG